MSAGGGFDRKEELLARLRPAPGAEARQEVAAGPEGPAPSGWTLQTIRVTLPWWQDDSLSGVGRVLNGFDLGVRSVAVQRSSPDPESAVKEAPLDTCLREAARRPEEVVVLLLDERGYCRWPDPAVDGAPTAPATVPRVAVAGTHPQWRVIGGLTALTGRVHYRDHDIVGREQIVRFSDQLDQAYPAARRISLVEENWSVQRHPAVLAALRARPRLEVVWLPTSAPWLNPLEQLWRWLRQDVLRRHRWAADGPGRRERGRAFLDQFSRGSQELLHSGGLRGEGQLAQQLQQLRAA